jgi:phosphate transport system protein
MFDKFKELFSSESLLDEAFDTTVTMLEYDKQMFEVSRMTLREENTSEMPFDVRKMDRRINKYEREVRRKVLAHLTIAGTANLVPGLGLISIVIDVERIGDYTKNMVDLARHHAQPLKGAKWEEDLKQIETAIDTNFVATIDALKNQSKSQGRKVMKAEDDISRHCEEIVSDIITGGEKQLSAGDAASLALYARYLKRINSHLTNIASAVVNPFPRISFRAKKKHLDTD